MGTTPRRQGVYLGFRRDGADWSSIWGPGGRGEGAPADAMPRPKRGQRLPESLECFRRSGPPEGAVTIEEQETARRAPDWVGHWTEHGTGSQRHRHRRAVRRDGFRIEWHEGTGSGAEGIRDRALAGDREAVLNGPAPETTAGSC